MITFSRVSRVLCYSSHRTNCFSSPDSNSCHQNNREFYVYILFFSLCVFPLSCKCPKFLFTRKQRTDLSLFLCPFVDVGADIFACPQALCSSPVGQSIYCFDILALISHGCDKILFLQNVISFDCSSLFLLYVSFFTIYSKKNIWTPDFSYALSQKYLSCGLKYKTKSGPLTGMVQTSSSNATVSHMDGLPMQKGEFIQQGC